MRVSHAVAAVTAAVSLSMSAGLMSSATALHAKPTRTFDYARVVELTDGALSFRARVADYPNSPIDLMKKDCKTCAWHQVAARTTNATGRVASRIQAPAKGRWYWRYRTPATSEYAVTFSATWYTFTH